MENLNGAHEEPQASRRRVTMTLAQVEEMEKLREEMSKARFVPAPSPLPPPDISPNYRFSKTGPMEYEVTNKDTLNILTGMLDMLQLGYTINTDYGAAGKISRWVITIYDPT